MFLCCFFEPVNRYNFLDKSVGISSVFEISNASLIDEVSQIVETSLPLSIPGVDGLLIPSNTRGHILKVIDGNAALIRWEVNYLCFLDPIVLHFHACRVEVLLTVIDLYFRL